MFIKVRKYRAPYFTAEDYRISGPPATYVYGCHVAPITLGALGYVSYREGIIQGHPGHRCPGRALGLCSRIAFQAMLSLDVNAQTVSFMSYP